MQKDSIAVLKGELTRAHNLIATEQGNVRDLRSKYEIIHKKEDQYIQAIDSLHQRIAVLEQNLSKKIMYIDEI